MNNTAMHASLLDSVRSAIVLPSLSQRVLLAVVLGVVIATMRFTSKGKGPMPPGPRGLPLLGNIFQLPKFQWYRFTEWKEEFGNSFRMRVFMLGTKDNI